MKKLLFLLLFFTGASNACTEINFIDLSPYSFTFQGEQAYFNVMSHKKTYMICGMPNEFDIKMYKQSDVVGQLVVHSDGTHCTADSVPYQNPFFTITSEPSNCAVVIAAPMN